MEREEEEEEKRQKKYPCVRMCSQFDILREKWNLAAELNIARFGAASCSITSNSIATVGGQGFYK